MECEKCKSENLEFLKEEHIFLRNLFYDEPDECFELYFRCKECGHEFIECM